MQFAERTEAGPEPFRAVGLWYEDFTQTEDDEVRGLMEEAADRVNGR